MVLQTLTFSPEFEVQVVSELPVKQSDPSDGIVSSGLVCGNQLQRYAVHTDRATPAQLAEIRAKHDAMRGPAGCFLWQPPGAISPMRFQFLSEELQIERLSANLIRIYFELIEAQNSDE